MAKVYDDTPQPPKKKPKGPKYPGHGAGSGTGTPTVNPNPPSGYDAERDPMRGIMHASVELGTLAAMQNGGWDAGSLVDATIAEMGGGGSDSGGGGGYRRRGGGGGGGGGGASAADFAGQLAGADAQTAALQAYLAQLQASQGLREKPFQDAQANLSQLYEAGRGTIGSAQTDLLARLQANRGGSEQAYNDYAAQAAQTNQQAAGSGQAELARLLTDLRAQGMDTTALEAQSNIQGAGLEQAFLRDSQRNAALQRAMQDAFASRDSTAGMVNTSALGGLEANRMNLGNQISQQQAAAMLQFQQELAQAQLQVAQQQAQADAVRAQMAALGLAAPAAPTAAVQAPVTQTPASTPAAPAPTAVDGARAPGSQSSAPTPPVPVPPSGRQGAVVDPALIQRYLDQMSAPRSPMRPQFRGPSPFTPLPRGR